MVLVLALLSCGVDPTVSEKVVEYAQSKLGEQVGDGECTALAVSALQHAGARRPRPNADTWGDELKSLRDAQPGDILQFDGAVFFRRRVRSDGAVITQTASFQHHTAIVARVRKRGPQPVLIIFHQNSRVDGTENRRVHEWTIDMAAKRAGTVKAYRPVPADAPRPPATEAPAGKVPGQKPPREATRKGVKDVAPNPLQR